MRKSLLRHISLGEGQRVKINGPLLGREGTFYHDVPGTRLFALFLSLSLFFQSWNLTD